MADNSSGYNQATLFDPTGNGHNINLGSLIGYDQSGACCINNKGQIVGYAYTFPRILHLIETAVLFDATGNGNNIDLNTLIYPPSDWNLMRATAINDNGWIVGYAKNPSGKEEAFLLVPVEVPDCSEQILGDLDRDCF